MCGIVGIAHRDEVVDTAALVRMRDTLTHRGPDDAGIWCSRDRHVGLAHRRLAIIDLSAAAAQPMADDSGGLCLAFNGEIYNYRELRNDLRRRGHPFRTSSDTEVILRAYREWGTACLSRLVGMFAFALYDSNAGRLFCARDRAGEKPLFYWRQHRTLQFASELKALLVQPLAPRAVDRDALEFYLACGFVPGDRSMLQGMHKLPPAHAFTYDVADDCLSTWRYWNIPRRAEEARSTEELTDELQALLEDSVRRQLVADVPVGILLSGGLDSSLITALASRVSTAPPRTFTVSFPGHRREDERAYARLVADHFATDHAEIIAEPATVDLLPRLAAQYDEPLADSSMVPTYLVSRAIRETATVALGGDGGDELFGGYQPYCWILQQQKVRRFVPAGVQGSVGAAMDRWLPVGIRGRNYLKGYTADLSDSIAHLRVFFDPPARARLLRTESASAESPEGFLGSAFAADATTVQRMTGTDFTTYLPDDLLVKVDRASMLTSLEVRAPFLDHRVVEFAFGRVPDRLKVTTRARKILLRRLAARILPHRFDSKRKQGFSLPLNVWLRGEWGAYFRDVLSEAPTELFDPREIAQLLDAQQRGRSHAHRLFALTMFELWRREYRIVT